MPTPARGPAPPRSLARSATVVSLAVLASRVLGLLRELLFAAFFGAGAAVDAFVTAFRIPNLFRDLFAEGALSAAFVKTFSQTLDKDGEPRAWRLASLVFNVLAVVVGGIALLGIVFAPAIVAAIGPGFEEQTRALAVELTRWMFPFLLFVSLAAVAMGILNARGVFGAPSLASSFFNVGSIVVGLLLAFVLAPEFMAASWRAILAGSELPDDAPGARGAIFGMALGVLAGGAMQLLCQVPALRRTGFAWSFHFDWRDPGLRSVLALMGPAVIGTAATQVNVFVNNNFASRIEGAGAVAALYYAFRLMQFPIGVFGVAIATAALPAAARAAGRADREGFPATLASALSLAVFLTLPSAVGLSVLGEEIVALVYERGRFDAAATVQAAGALSMYAIGLVGYSLVKILAPASYALDDARSPAWIAVGSIGVNYALCAVLVEPYGVRGLALSTSVVATANALLLLYTLTRKSGALPWRDLASRLLRVALASVALALAARFAADRLTAMLAPERSLERGLVVFGAIGAGGLAYLAAAALFRLPEVAQLRRFAGRRR